MAAVSRSCEINPNLLQRGRKEFQQSPERAFPRLGKKESRREPGRRTGAENRPTSAGDRFFEGALAAPRITADAAGVDWKAALYQQVRQEMSGHEWAMERRGALAGVSRRTLYRFAAEAKPADRAMDRRDAIQRSALEMPSYGRPRMSAEWRRHGRVVKAKRVHRLRREDNLLCRRRQFSATADSRHEFPIYANLAGAAANQYQAASARRYHVYSTGERVRVSGRRSGCLFAPGDWLGARPQPGGEAHRSGAPGGLVAPPQGNGSGASFWWWPSVCSRQLHQPAGAAGHSHQHEPQRKSLRPCRTQSFRKTLKEEEVYRQEYRDLADALRSLRRFLEQVYSEKRLHSSLRQGTSADSGLLAIQVYTMIDHSVTTKKAKLFNNGRSQAVRLPAVFRFEGTEVYIRKDETTGDVILSRKPNTRDELFALRDLNDPDTRDFLKDRVTTPRKERGLF